MFAQLGRPDWHLALFYIELAEFSIPIDVSWVLDNALSRPKSAHLPESAQSIIAPVGRRRRERE
jgi:hypothetical protein